MIFFLFQTTTLAAIIPDSVDLEFTLPASKLYYTINGDTLDFTVPFNKFNYTVDE